MRSNLSPKTFDHTKRRLLLSSLAASISAASPFARAGEAQPVWRGMNQKALDQAYDQRVWAPDLPRFVERFATASERTRGRLGPPTRYSYGDSDIEGLDFFSAQKKSAPVFIFIHGGAWRLGAASENAFMVEALLRAGAHVILPDFSWVQDVEGNLFTIVAQLRRAMAWIYQNNEKLSIDRKQIYVGGHSSGGHLAAVMLTTDWTRHNLPRNLFKGGLCSSGMFNLEPVSLSARRKYVAFTPTMVNELSPINHIKNINAPIFLTRGTLESPEFIRQTTDFAAALKKEGKSHKTIVAQGYNHFEVIETLGNPYGDLGAATLQLMQLDATG